MAIIIVEQSFPSYLTEFLGFESDCVLVYKKRPYKSSASSDHQLDNSVQGNRSIDNETNPFDLTGNPLEVDLDDNLTLLPNSVFSPTTPIWSVEESQHFPLSIGDARNLLNNKFNCKKSPIPTFCVTDGSDSKKTVIIGGHYSDDGIAIHSAHILGVYLANDVKLSLEQLQLETQNDLKSKNDCVKYNFMRVYNMHGLPTLKEYPGLENDFCNGSMVLKTTWNTYLGEEPAAFETRLKLVLKVVSAHNNSLIRFIWVELCKLQKLIDLLKNERVPLDGDTLISDDYVTISDLINSIHNLCMSKLKKRRQVDHKCLDLSDLREETVLDKLWCLLNKCQNLKDLKNSFTTFFTVANFENFETDDGVIILQQCLEKKDYLLNFTVFDALKLLIYMGFEKLKQDYLTILNFYSPFHQVELEKKWANFRSQDQQKFGKISLPSNSLRITDVSYNENKMDFLLKLHDAAELLVFLKKDVKTCTTITAENFTTICKHIYEKYVFVKSEKQSDNRLKAKLLDIRCDLNSANIELYKGRTPMTSIFETISTIGACEVKTIIHISQKPIFPKSIFDSDAGGDGLMVGEDLPAVRYVSKFVTIRRPK